MLPGDAPVNVAGEKVDIFPAQSQPLPGGDECSAKAMDGKSEAGSFLQLFSA